MLKLQFLRDLNVDPSLHPRGQAHLSAASGLARMHGLLFVVADDEHHLGVLEADKPAAVRLLRLFPGDLPKSKAKRKAVKPDLETLLALPTLPGYPSGALLALGSGSRPNRRAGVLMAVDDRGDLSQPPRIVDLRPLYDPLSPNFERLNIEGAFVAAGALHLLQRANKADPRNACISFAWNEIAPWLLGSAAAPPAQAIRSYELGAVDGVPLGFTDAATLPGGAWVFSAVAEDTDDNYADAACKGSVIGFVDAAGNLCSMQALDRVCKVEGLTAQQDGELLTLTLVTDADDPQIASQLLCATLSASASGLGRTA